MFGLIGELMISFQTEMIANPPPKEIKRVKNKAETELLDGEEMGIDASEEEDDENEVDAEQQLAALLVRLCLLLG